MSVWAIVPVKPLNRAKSRLATVLSPEMREALSTAMLRHTIASLAECRFVSGILVISRDNRALVIAREYGARTVQESGAPALNAALERASQVIASWSAQASLVLPADLPLLDVSDIQEMAHLGRFHQSAVVVPDREGTGTNGLLLRPPNLFPISFGVGSFERHVTAAETAGATVHVFRSERLMLDLDMPDDLLAYLDLCTKYGVEPLVDLAIQDLIPSTTASQEEKTQ